MESASESTPLLFSKDEEPIAFNSNFNPQVLEVKDLVYEVDLKPDWQERVRKFDPFGRNVTWKTILNGVSLVARPGQVLAILGSSGSGKTTLLDILACRSAGGRISGDVLLNNRPATQKMIKAVGAYVTQEDRFLPNLTVKETLTFVALMKFPSSVSYKDKISRVTTVMAELGLRHVADTLIGGESSKGISGGERRRVSIGCQLLLDPSILFLDEPTSGLDSFTAEYIVQILVSLSRSNRTVITTIHSPRTDIFQLFDQVLLLSQGDTVYFGAARNMVPYFDKLGFKCPQYTNPCDYFMDISTIDFRSPEQTITSRKTVSYLVEQYQGSHEKGGLTRKPTIPLVDERNSISKPLNRFYQFYYLYIRATTNLLKGYPELIQQLLESVAMGIVIGAIYFNIGYSQISITDRYGLFFILSSLFPFKVILMVIAKFCKERPPFYNEREDGLYDLLPYFFAKTLSELPFDVLFAITYAMPGYFMIGLNDAPLAFARYIAIVILSIYTSRSIALATAAGIITFQKASFIGNLTFSLFLFPSGFLINLDTMSKVLRWTAEISYLKFSFEAFAINEFTGLNFTCNPLNENLEFQTGQDGCIRTGEEALQDYALGDIAIQNLLLYFLVAIFFFRVLQYFLLRFVPQRPS